jgi:anti-repressor protein
VTAQLARRETVVHRFPQTGQDIRIVQVGADPWFVGRDVAEALGYANTRKAVKDHVPAGHRRGNEAFPLGDLGLQPQTVLIDEAGMYRLIMRANTATAEQFQEWVTAEVLPAIRRTGAYQMPAGVTAALPSPRELAQLVIAEADRADRAEKQVAELEPAAGNWNALADAEGDYSLREAGFMLKRSGVDTGQNRLMADIRRLAMVDARGRPYVRYNRYLVERPVSYTHPRTAEPMLTTQIRVTVEGIAYLRNRLAGRS